jgi:catechol 2,3-dioxygenase-like lactoylglutathione lyase family enzyme
MITAMPRIAVATRNFAACVGDYRDELGLPVVDLSASSVDGLGARLAMCVPDGGSNIELMSPARTDAPLAQSLERFLSRRGEGLFALMLEAPDPDAEAEVLRQRGLDVLPLMAGAAGRDIHPRSTHGVLVRVYPTNSFRSSADQISGNPARSLHLSGIVRVVIAVNDVDRALDVYGRGFGLDHRDTVLDEARGVVSALLRPPAGGSIELVAVDDDRPWYGAAIARHLAQCGEGMFALVLRAPDPSAVRSGLAARGVRFETIPNRASVLAIAPDERFHARLLIEPEHREHESAVRDAG